MLLERGFTPTKIRESLCKQNLELVFTAHPTQSIRRSILKKFKQVSTRVSVSVCPCLSLSVSVSLTCLILFDVNGAAGRGSGAEGQPGRPKPTPFPIRLQELERQRRGWDCSLGRQRALRDRKDGEELCIKAENEKVARARTVSESEG